MEANGIKELLNHLEIRTWRCGLHLVEGVGASATVSMNGVVRRWLGAWWWCSDGTVAVEDVRVQR